MIYEAKQLQYEDEFGKCAFTTTDSRDLVHTVHHAILNTQSKLQIKEPKHENIKQPFKTHLSNKVLTLPVDANGTMNTPQKETPSVKRLNTYLQPQTQSAAQPAGLSDAQAF